MKTTIGALTHLFQWKEGSVAVAAGAGVGAIGGPGLGALAAGVVALAKLGIYIAEQLIDEKEVRRGTDSEVAILYEVQKQFGGADTAKS